MIAKTREQVERLRTAGRLMAEVVEEVLALVRPGVSSLELEEAARRATLSRGARPSFLNYKNKGEKEYPAALCVSINDEIAHSPPRQGKILKAGDIVSIDFGLEFQGAFMDTAYTLAVGEVDEGGRRLIDGTREALDAALAAARKEARPRYSKRLARPRRRCRGARKSQHTKLRHCRRWGNFAGGLGRRSGAYFCRRIGRNGDRCGRIYLQDARRLARGALRTHRITCERRFGNFNADCGKINDGIECSAWCKI